ncbi:MAG: sensor histidine kinase, partial [Clostridia bacterium]
LIGEYKDKFEEKNLEVISNLSKVNVKIKADSRYLYRVIDNLFGNISKYALEGSRVYIETEIIDGGKIKTILKNISKDKLNISEEELMQRFVRGDKSRTTEGSGLGLAIARSLTELQKGNLDCKIDGDLFKVEITFDII